jgi:hypothetical protein
MCILLVLIHFFWFCHADVGPIFHEVDASQGLVDEKVEEWRARRHYRFVDPEVGPTHVVGEGLTHGEKVGPMEGHGRVKPREHDREMKDLRRHLEGILDRVLKDLWLWIWDKGILDPCIGGDLYWCGYERVDPYYGYFS